jgi:hypothetical protein
VFEHRIIQIEIIRNVAYRLFVELNGARITDFVVLFLNTEF